MLIQVSGGVAQASLLFIVFVIEPLFELLCISEFLIFLLRLLEQLVILGLGYLLLLLLQIVLIPVMLVDEIVLLLCEIVHCFVSVKVCCV